MPFDESEIYLDEKAQSKLDNKTFGEDRSLRICIPDTGLQIPVGTACRKSLS